MSRISYVNGRYLPHAQAMVHIEDRGYQFSDGIYEVVGVHDGLLLDEEGHLKRMQRSLTELQIEEPVTLAVMRLIIREIKKRNKLKFGLVYIQITRGVAPRLHTFPEPTVLPSLVVMAQPKAVATDAVVKKGIGVITHPEIRWARCDIKSVSLLGNILVKQKAQEQGCKEAWFVDDKGFITEGTASNAWIINKEGVLQTCPKGDEILGGITREAIIRIAQEMGLKVLEKSFTLKDAEEAREAFVTSATNYVMPVTTINGKNLKNSNAIQTTLDLRKRYIEEMVRLSQG